MHHPAYLLRHTCNRESRDIERARCTRKGTTLHPDKGRFILLDWVVGTFLPPTQIPIKLLTHLHFLHSLQTLQPTPLQTPHQSVDQTGFRPGYSKTDHLCTFQQLRQKATEWHQTPWVGATVLLQEIMWHCGTAGFGGPCVSTYLRQTTSNCAHGRQKQPIPSEAENQAG